MDRRVLIIRRWLILIASVALCLACEPGLWFCLFAAPIIWTRTSGGTTGILIHPDGSGGWKIAVGDSADATCACCGGTTNCSSKCTESPSSVTLVFTGIANNECLNCNTYNATHVITESSSATACHGIKSNFLNPCTGFNASGITWEYIQVGADTVFEVILGNICGINQDVHRWRHTLGSSPVSCYMTSQAVSPFSETLICGFGGTGHCTNISSTCTVTTTP